MFVSFIRFSLSIGSNKIFSLTDVLHCVSSTNPEIWLSVYCLLKCGWSNSSKMESFNTEKYLVCFV